MAMNVTSKLVLAFVTLLLGAVLIGVIATNGLAVTDRTGVSSESHIILPTILTGRNSTDINDSIVYTITNAPTGWKLSDNCPITSFSLTNSTGTALTETTDYVVDLDAGTWVFVNSAGLNDTIDVATNETLAGYQYCPDDYMNLTWGRTVINLVSGFFALALLGASLGLFYDVAKDTGML